MTSRNYLLPNAAQCDSLTDEQCRMIQDILDPDGIRTYKDWAMPHQSHLIRLYMKGMSFPDIAKAMRRRIDCSYKTYNNRFRSWLFPTTPAEREQKIIELYSKVANQYNPASTEVTPLSQSPMLLPIRPSPGQQNSQVPARTPFPHPSQPYVSDTSQHRVSVSTTNTFTSSSGSSAYTQFDDTLSNRFSVASTNSSFSSTSHYAAPRQQTRPQSHLQPAKTPKHDGKAGLWNDSLRVIPCEWDHSLWREDFARCSVCGFSQWHALMLNAGSYSISEFHTAMLRRRDLIKHDFAGNFPLHFLMSAGVGMEYFIYLIQQCDTGGQNVFGQNPLHVLDPHDLGDQLISFLEYFNKLDPFPGILLSQRDIHCISPLQTLLQRPLERNMYRRVLKTFPGAVFSLRSLDTSGRGVAKMMDEASLKVKSESTTDWMKIQAGITETRLFLSEAENQSGSVHDYGFHDIARGARGTPLFGLMFLCRICHKTDAHSNSYLDQMQCALDHGRNVNATDETGITPAHLLVTHARCNTDFSPETPSQTAQLFRMLLPRNYPNLREALHVLDPEGNNLIFNIATRGFCEILDYALSLEEFPRRSAMVNACSQRPKTPDGTSSVGEWSVLQAVEEKLHEVDERIKMVSLTTNLKELDRLCVESNRLKMCKNILKVAGSELSPSITTRYKICE
ncbi:hypothetical protein BKA64DRAFT_344157 [Cadophora sp. MPI-SDFR-AT-0126]|nr:hypothetical protein BKA64DRAFT_344157 [Leotiomycetes sp. MPI-SDFR-AT-0126]